MSQGSTVCVSDIGKEHLHATSTLLLVLEFNIWQACKYAEDS